MQDGRQRAAFPRGALLADQFLQGNPEQTAIFTRAYMQTGSVDAAYAAAGSRTASRSARRAEGEADPARERNAAGGISFSVSETFI